MHPPPEGALTGEGTGDTLRSDMPANAAHSCTCSRAQRFPLGQRSRARRVVAGTVLHVAVLVAFAPHRAAADAVPSAGKARVRIAQNTEENHGPSALPEGSASVIESLTWRLAGPDPAALRARVKALVGRTAGAVIVKDSADQLVTSLPTSELATLRQALTTLGELSGPEAAASDAPTTLLRVQFVRPQ